VKNLLNLAKFSLDILSAAHYCWLIWRSYLFLAHKVLRLRNLIKDRWN